VCVCVCVCVCLCVCVCVLNVIMSHKALEDTGLTEVLFCQSL
jgi:hypothetical protein